MVRQSGIGDIEFFLYLADDEPIGMSGQEELHDAEPGLGAHGVEHVGVFGDLLGGFLSSDGCHISIVAETWVYCQGQPVASGPLIGSDESPAFALSPRHVSRRGQRKPS